MSGFTNVVAGAAVEVGGDLGRVGFERIGEAAVAWPVVARFTRALGVAAPHEASAKTIPASSPNRTIVELRAGRCGSVA